MKRPILAGLFVVAAVAGALAPSTASAEAPRKAYLLKLGIPCSEPCGGEFPGLCTCQINDPIIIT